MAVVTLATLRTRALALADMENSGFVITARLNEWVNAEANELYDLLITKFEDYFLTTGTISLVSGTAEYSLPSGFYKLRGVDYPATNSRNVSLRPFNFANRNRISDSIRYAWDMQYLVHGTNPAKLRLMPSPSAAATLTVWYAPQRTAYSLDADEQEWYGWEDFIVAGAAARCLMKEESDPSGPLSLKESLRRRIDEASANRDAAEPARVVDVHSIDEEADWPWHRV